MSEVLLAALVSTYKEGRLVQGAIRSLLDACDYVYVFEGPCGDPIAGDVPETDLGPYASSVRYFEGCWRTDARKRSDIIARVKQHLAPQGRPLWGLWLDGDEVLFNGEYLRDMLQALNWRDEQQPDEPPHLGKPLRLVELDGSVVWCRAKLLRLDLVQRFEVSTATFTNERGVVQGGGNFPDSLAQWLEPRRSYYEAGQVVQLPPISGEPHVLHRSALRHPLRAGNRLHEQEAAELAKRKQPAGA